MFSKALDSLRMQTRLPGEVVVVTKPCDPESARALENYLENDRLGISWRHVVVDGMSILAAEQAAVSADPWHGPGTTLSSARSSVRRLLTGRLPWREPSRVGPKTPVGVAAERAGATRRKTRTMVFDTLGRPVATLLAQAQSLVGYGNFLDVIARTASSPEGKQGSGARMCEGAG